MEYLYNGNLLESERIEQVSHDITNKYPVISLDKAYDAALLEDKISTYNITNDFKLNRLYNIMLVYRDNKYLLLYIFIDYLNILNNNSNISNIYSDIAKDIKLYLVGEHSFPFISDYM